MSKDITLENIKSGKGLSPLRDEETSPIQSDNTSVQKNERGIVYESSTPIRRKNNKEDKKIRILKLILSSILGGICIGIGGTAYLSCESPIAGAILFSIGLLTICVFELSLYTGKVGYVFQNSKSYTCDILIILLFNLAGAWIMGLLIRLSGLTDVINGATIHAQNTLNTNLLSLFVLAVLCNIMIYIAIEGYHKANNEVAKIIILVMSVTVFIMCGFKHSIAEMYYFSVAGLSLDIIIPMLVMIAGNAVGGITAHNLRRLSINEPDY